MLPILRPHAQNLRIGWLGDLKIELGPEPGTVKRPDNSLNNFWHIGWAE